ncbi:hypothetical protein [Ideonella oryzae]|uniref:Uncharacterized protein n=1 Tax=Ideonella oryzae TaxID=2937441 RepID=A0ABT1BJV4_9BURK|nr:hypothetical protein [Ideonella oryzae]MCO5975896.1 hypothetical protein [Ideonella oryzae]
MSSRRVLSRACRLVFTLWATAAGGLPAGAQATLPEVQVSTSLLLDYEFDWGRDGVSCPSCNQGAGNARVAFVDSLRRLWVADVDVLTGNFVPANGRGILVDSNAALTSTYLNGPEWVNSQLGSQLVYNKYQTGAAPSDQTVGLGVASFDGTAWSSTLLGSSLGKVNPIGSGDAGDTAPILHYQNTSTSAAFARRELEPTSQVALSVCVGTASSSRRSVPGTHKIIITGVAGAGLYQIFLYDMDTGVTEQLTDEWASLSGAFMWPAPEYGGEYVFFAVRNGQEIVVYRQLPDGQGQPRWTAVLSQGMPDAAYPFVWSPEYFVHNGRSYIFFQMNASPVALNYTQPSRLAMMGITPETGNIVMLTPDDAPVRARTDPEYFITTQGPFIYYNRYRTVSGLPVSEGVWRVDTGLGAPATGLGVGR